MDLRARLRPRRLRGGGGGGGGEAAFADELAGGGGGGGGGGRGSGTVPCTALEWLRTAFSLQKTWSHVSHENEALRWAADPRWFFSASASPIGLLHTGHACAPLPSTPDTEQYRQGRSARRALWYLVLWACT